MKRNILKNRLKNRANKIIDLNKKEMEYYGLRDIEVRVITLDGEFDLLMYCEFVIRNVREEFILQYMDNLFCEMSPKGWQDDCYERIQYFNNGILQINYQRVMK